MKTYGILSFCYVNMRLSVIIALKQSSRDNQKNLPDGV